MTSPCSETGVDGNPMLVISEDDGGQLSEDDEYWLYTGGGESTLMGVYSCLIIEELVVALKADVGNKEGLRARLASGKLFV